MQSCDHVGFHSGQGRYDRIEERIRYVLVCDACDSELRELDSSEYRPRYEAAVPQGAAA
jgi:hypothetical protein